jgi:hypothetical protein
VAREPRLDVLQAERLAQERVGFAHHRQPAAARLRRTTEPPRTLSPMPGGLRAVKVDRMGTSVPTSGAVEALSSDYPVEFDVDYPERHLDRLTTFFRPLVAVPILVVLGLLLGGWSGGGDQGTTGVVTGGGLLVTDRHPPFSLR